MKHFAQELHPADLQLFPGIAIQECIYESQKSLIYRGVRRTDERPVIVKQLKRECASPKEVSRFRLEYQLTQRLDLQGVIGVYEYLLHKDVHALVLEDFGGESLERLMGRFHRWSPPRTADALATFVEYAVALADTVSRIHQHNIIHKDLKPHNIVLNTDTRVIKIIDFGIASLISQETPEIMSPDLLEGTLAYISPEQTGRMNRAIDNRSDLYSLGVTFYEMLTGSLPFESRDSMELVHAHMAKRADAPTERNPAIPEALSRIVLKLLSKSPEERYQGAYGLKMDLLECGAQLQARGSVEVFDLGRNDNSGTFQPRATLYGRTEIIQGLLDTFAEVSNGTVQNALVLVGGYSGIGKSSLINEVHKPLTQHRGHFISGKFDQFKRNIPFASFVQAFQGLIRQLLVESDESIRVWRAKLLTALGSNGQVIVDVLPEVEKIIGPQAPVPELGAVENQNRFNQVFRSFCNVFCQREHPLVIFLDDLQWADPPTLTLIHLIMTDADIRYLMFIGAYRDNEVDDKHLLTKTLGEIRQVRPFRTITLTPLSFEDVDALVAEALLSDRERARGLTERVYEKTRGNPFFVKMFLKTIYQDGNLVFDLDRGQWCFDLEKIDAMGITDNVVDLMVGRLRRLPEDTQYLIALGASIGNQFNLRTLSMVSERSLADTVRPLWPALEQGLLVPIGDDYKWVEQHADGNPDARFRFLHDRVQQAAYSLIQENDQPSLHLKLGRLLLRHMTPEEFAEHMFEVVDHLNRGRALIEDRTERDEVARLNLRAARRAKLSSAYEPALNYVAAGLDYLPPEPWTNGYLLAYDLHLEKGELEYLVAQWDASIATFNLMLENARDLMDRARINALVMVSYRMKNDLKTALRTGKEALAELGVTISEFPTEDELQQELARCYEFLIASRDVESLFSLPETDDPKQLAILALLTECFTPAYFLGSRLLPIIGIRMSEICVRYGNNRHAPLGYIFLSSITLAFTRRDYVNARRWGRLSLRLNNERYHVKSSEAVILNMWGAFVCHYTDLIDTARKTLMKGYYSGIENGAYQWSGYCAINCLFMDFWGVMALRDVHEKIREILPGLERVDQNMAQYYYAIKATIRNLTDEVDDLYALSEEEWPNNRAILKRCRDENDLLTLFVDAVCKLSLANWFGDTAAALHYGKIASEFEVGAPGIYINPSYHLHHAIAYTQGYELLDPEGRAEALAAIELIRALFQKWAATSPSTYAHQLALIEAELARVRGDGFTAGRLFDEAIEGADRGGFLANEAFANELAGRFYLSQRSSKIAKVYLTDAAELYGRWGARAKVRAMKRAYGDLVSVPESAPKRAAPQMRHTMTLTRTAEFSDQVGNLLDMSSVIKATHALSSEMVLHRLLDKMMKILIENAGAQVGALILDRDGKLHIEAFEAVESPVGTVVQSTPLDDEGQKPLERQRLSTAIVKFVARSQEDVVLHDATVENSFSGDPFVVARRPKSILCIPIIHQAKLTGVLYLHNALTAGVFTPERLEFLRLLCSQAAISIQNSRLYETVEQKVVARTQELELKNGELASALHRLKEAQGKVIAQEKLAYLGTLTAGIAHEIKNPLNFIKNFAELSLELIVELAEAPSYASAGSAVHGAMDELREYLQKIGQHSERADNIVRNMLMHSRERSGANRRPVNLNALLDQHATIAYRGLRAENSQYEVEIVREYDDAVGLVDVIPEGLGRAFLNIVDNACFSTQQKRDKVGSRLPEAWRPRVSIKTRDLGDRVEVRIRDNGLGIPSEIVRNVFNPFFTTKAPGQGTGLGLSITYDVVVKEHGGTIDIDSIEGEYAEFIIVLPHHAASAAAHEAT